MNNYYLKLKNDQHAKQIQICYKYNNENVILDLDLIDNLMSSDHFLSYQEPNGEIITKRVTRNEAELCHYRVSL